MNVSENGEDIVLAWIKSEWDVKSGENNWKACAKLLRLFVNHVKTNEGIPIIHQQEIRDKASTLMENLGSMELDAAAQCVSSIDHANARLDSTHSFGTSFKTGLDPDELAAIKRKYRRVACRSTGTEPVKP